MDLTFTVAARIAKPVAEVFEAIVNPAQLSRYCGRAGLVHAVPRLAAKRTYAAVWAGLI